MSLTNKQICIVIPLYKTQPEMDEILSFNQCLKVLQHHDIYVVCPPELILENYALSIAAFESVSIIRFDAHYFQSIKGYNELMLSVAFYKAFVSYKYMLLYQLDAWIFEDNLSYWCSKNYDYVGAPALDWEWTIHYSKHITPVRSLLTKLGFTFSLVGNGGLSLRKISSAIRNLRFFSKQASAFNLNEDYFFSFWIPSYNPFYRIPNNKVALQFAFDENPDICYEKNEQRLPMACHAWPKYKAFWKKFIPFENQKLV